MGADPRRSLGAAGEALAAAWYERRGYQVVDRNWRTRGGELDLVVQAPRLLVFCEVKSRRTNTFGAPIEAVTVAKQRRIRVLATEWMSHRTIPRATQVRFDVVSVRLRAGEPPQLDVVEAAF